jgi:predicted lipid-binding transport protein (Tim44 family)
MPSMVRVGRLRALAVIAATLILIAGTVDARPGRGGGGFGSRGARTFQAPPVTATAPRQAAPIERSTMPAQQAAATQRLQGSAAMAPGGFFRRGGGFFGGLLGAGLIGGLLGYGLLAGLGGLGSFIGLLLQVALIVILARWALRAFQRRLQPAPAGAGSRLSREATAPPSYDLGPAGSGASSGPVTIGPADYDAFERALSDIQDAYGREDMARLRASTTAEMASYLERELAENAGRGVVNRTAGAKLLQGDLAEAWREGETDYATVAVRFSLTDYTEDRATGRIVEGDPNVPVEAAEVWTFRRDRGRPWRLSAIQPA